MGHAANERRIVRALWSIALLLAAQFGALASTADAASTDTVFARGSAGYMGSPFFDEFGKVNVDIVSSPSGNGYSVIDSRGFISTFGDATWHGDTRFFNLNSPIVGMARHPSGNGYWLLAKDSGIFAYGAAQFFGSAWGQGEAVDIVATTTGNGYWILLADGQVKHFGDAADLADISGSASSRAVGLARSGSGSGYWELLENGQVFAFGDAPFFGDGTSANKPFAAIAARPDGAGYWLLARDGTIYGRGSAAAFDAIASTYAIVSGAAHPSGTGLWALSSGTPDPGAIQGIVKNTGGEPVSGICVRAQNFSFNMGTAVTSVTGFYRINGLKPGSYQVQFQDCTNDTYFEQWYSNADTSATATPVNVQAGKTTFKIGATMAAGGLISGGVRDDMGNPAYSCVIASDPATGVWASATTITGAYKVGPLKPGSYKVTFTSCGSRDKLSQTWPASDHVALGHPVAVTAGGHARNISGVLRTPGQITGVVTNSTGSPLSGVCVAARLPGVEDRSGGETPWTSGGSTSITGFYRLGGLHTGSYAVSFRDCGGANHAPEWFHDAPSEEQADVVHVEAGLTTSDINESLATGAVVSGSVQSGDGPIANACVSAWQDGQQFPSVTAYSSVTGFYRMQGLQAGTYRVHFKQCWASDYAPEWWHDSPSREGATALDLEPGEEANEVIGVLSSSPGAISGVVKTVSNADAVNACVVAEDSAGIKHQAYTSVTGFYRITGLGAQAYKVRFDPCASGPGAPEWFNNKANLVAANPVNVALGATTPDVNAKFETAGSISGVVTQTGGQPLGTCLTLTDTAGNLVREGHSTSMTGFYRIDGLHGGLYKLKFGECVPGPYEKEWWNDADSVFTADTITVAAGAVTTANGELALEVADAPTGVSAAGGNSSATVSWTAPGYEGTSPTSVYEVTAWAGGFPVRTVTVPSSQTSAVVTGLQNNKQYRFRVAARNPGGLGKQSLLSNAVTPALTASIEVPGTTTAPAVVTFSDIVKGVTTSNLIIRQTGSGGSLTAGIVCKNQGGATVSCATGLVKTATLQPAAPLTGGTQYTVVVNPVGVAPIRDFAGNIVNRTSATFTAGAAAAGVTRA